MDDREERIGRVAFDAYRSHVGGVTYDGKAIPEWEGLSEQVRSAWVASAEAVSRAVGGIY